MDNKFDTVIQVLVPEWMVNALNARREELGGISMSAVARMYIVKGMQEVNRVKAQYIEVPDGVANEQS